MQLADDNTLSTINDEGAVWGHVRNRTEEDILNNGVKILMVRIRAVELQFGFQGHGIGKAALETFFHTVARRVNVIVQEFEDKVVARVGYREVLGEHLVQAVILAQFGWGVKL